MGIINGAFKRLTPIKTLSIILSIFLICSEDTGFAFSTASQGGAPRAISVQPK